MASFLHGVLARLNIHNVQLRDFDGKTQLASYLKALSLLSGFPESVTRLGVVRDADSDPKGAFASCCSALQAAGLSAPGAPGVLSSANPAVCVFVLPDSHSQGKLETLLLRSVQNREEMKCIGDLVECLGKGDREKSLVHVYMACCERPGAGIGVAVQRGDFPLDSPAFEPLKSFLSTLTS